LQKHKLAINSDIQITHTLFELQNAFSKRKKIRAFVADIFWPLIRRLSIRQTFSQSKQILED